MRVLIALNHPAHYYVFKYATQSIVNKGVEVKFLIRNKDVLEKLLISEGVEYKKIAEKKTRKPSVFSVLFKGLLEFIKQDIKLLQFVISWRPNLMLGTDIAITHIGRVLNIPSLVFNEDDYEVNRLFCIFSYPFATKIVAPLTCSVGKFESKKVGYNGMQKMAYLHPKYFTPDPIQIKDVVSDKSQYFIIRLVSLTSGHDIEGKHTGLTEKLVDQIISILETHGKVFINSEDKLNPKYEPFRLKISPNKMHHLLAFARLFIGDSQTMCAEAGLLGTPFIRFNDFVGKIEYLNEIENKYGLGYGVPTKHPEKVIEHITEILNTQDIKKAWDKKRKIIFNEKIDSTAFYTDIIMEYLKKSQR